MHSQLHRLFLIAGGVLLLASSASAQLVSAQAVQATVETACVCEQAASWDDDNIVWGTRWDDDNIVWGTRWWDDNIVWGTRWDDDNIVWGTGDGGAHAEVSAAWDDDNIVWGTHWDDDNIVWGTGGESGF